MPLIARLPMLALLLTGAWSAAAADDTAKDYPNRTIRMIVPFPPGGPADTIARIVGQKMSEHWSEPVIIENRAGGNTAIGAQLVAKSAPDGYTLLVAMDVTMVMNPLVMKNLSYDPLKDFTPVTLLNKSIALITARSDGPKTIAYLIATAKAHPNTLSMGAGTITSRLGALAFAQSAGIDVTLVPYKGSADITQGLLTGAVDFAIDGVPNALPLIEAGKFRALAKYSNRPLPILPDVPSLSVAANLPNIGESSTWISLVAPAHTPEAIVDKLQREVAQTLGDPAMAERLRKAGLSSDSSTPQELEALIRNDTARWRTVIQNGVADKILE
ncbi:MAG: tripartite tricarboxylate transporter substrate binding protein [Xanthobacteraceae bacterium]